MNKDNDPMGHAVKDYFENGTSARLFVRSDICDTDEIPVSWLYRTYSEMPVVEQQAIELCRGDVLDVGAAAGAHTVELIKRGFCVTSVDLSEMAVEILKCRGAGNAKCIDFFDLSEKQKFDTLLFLMNGAGLAGDLNGLEILLQKCRRLLRPGGQILMDSSDITYLFDRSDMLPEYYYGEVEYQMIYNNIFSDPFKWLFVDYIRLEKQAEAAGFSCERIIGGQDNSYLAKLEFRIG